MSSREKSIIFGGGPKKKVVEVPPVESVEPVSAEEVAKPVTIEHRNEVSRGEEVSFIKKNLELVRLTEEEQLIRGKMINGTETDLDVQTLIKGETKLRELRDQIGAIRLEFPPRSKYRQEQPLDWYLAKLKGLGVEYEAPEKTK